MKVRQATSKKRLSQGSVATHLSHPGLAGNRTPAGLGWSLKPRDRRVTVVIPVLNESEGVASIVRLVLHSPLVGEVIVVDDGSIDDTPELAQAAGARVFTSTFLGKGGSMEEGLSAARHGTLLYLDGDLAGLSDDLVKRVTHPVLSGEADFVKARFSRRAGRVTVLTARPLLRTYFPELAQFEQPLGGIIAARKELLQRLRFENDYGVDVGLLIDAAALGARLTEVDIGHLEHDSHDLDYLGEMATQVARAILERASAYGRLRFSFVRRVRERERMLQVARELPLNPGAVEAVIGLRKLGYRVGIVTDSYHTAAETVRRRVFADFVLANVIEFRHGKATGVITLAPTFRTATQVGAPTTS